MQANHEELVCNFKEVLSVEASLRQKIITSVDVKYTTALQNRNTNSVKKIIDVILNHLFGTYGKITPNMLTQRECIVKKMTFYVGGWIDTVFNEVE